MSIENLALAPYEVARWQNAGFSTWTKPDGAALWVVSAFDSLVKGKSTLWHHTVGTGVFPSQTVDPDYDSTRESDLIDSPNFDLSPFGSSDDWHCQVRVWWRPEHVLPSLLGSDQQPERLEVHALANGVYHFLGELDQPIVDAANAVNSSELSRVAPDAGNANVGALGLWWYQQVIVPDEAAQAALIGQATVSLRLALQAAARDASGYGTGVELVTVEIMRGGVTDVVGAFPIHLHRSYINSRRWT